MCGIIGYIGHRNATPLLVEGLKRLEYRGYDSAGVAILDSGLLRIAKTKGKVLALEHLLAEEPLVGSLGIAHTRWATHGEPSERNAHPHASGQVAIVHNGIIENYVELREELQAKGAVFTSETDSEVISQWLADAMGKGQSLEEAFRHLLKKLKGAYAIVAISRDEPNRLCAARQGSPMVVGWGEEGEYWIGSDTLALAGCAARGIFLKDGEYVFVSRQEVQVFNASDETVEQEISPFYSAEQPLNKGNFDHYMLKEIHEQPDVIRKTLTHYYDNEKGQFHFEQLHLDASSISALTIVACGTSFFAAQVASYWFEQLAGIPVRIDIASEFRYRRPVMPAGTVAMFISQSGETADTLAAMRYAKQAGCHTIALVNVISSTMAREADSVIQTLAGPEIGVASTKAFIAQLTTLAALVLSIAKTRQTIDFNIYETLRHGLSDIADKIELVLGESEHYSQLALALMYARDMLFIGRGTSYPLALEGALKMKEISYIHAEGYAAGELKHGPIALVDDGVPIIVIAPDDELFDKSASNLEETAARKGNIVLISSKEKISGFKGNMTHHAALPSCPAFHAPLLYAVPLQLLAYYVALHKGADIDQPRNLAKSVTVE